MRLFHRGGNYPDQGLQKYVEYAPESPACLKRGYNIPDPSDQKQDRPAVKQNAHISSVSADITQKQAMKSQNPGRGFGLNFVPGIATPVHGVVPDFPKPKGRFNALTRRSKPVETG